MTDAIKMNPEVKAKIVAALRSGEYTQGKYLLRRLDNCFCVMGVVCDLYLKEKGLEWEVQAGVARYEFKTYYNVVPLEVKEWAGFDSEGGNIVEINGSRLRLYEHNDSGRTFAEIADAIEAQL